MTRNIVLAIACLAAGAAGGIWWEQQRPLAPPAGPMPAPSPAPAPSPSKPDTAPRTLQVQRVEVMDQSGRVAVVLTTQGGVPVAIISDNGRARVIDLAWLARKVE